MVDPRTLADVWPLVISLLFLVIWSIRLESKVLYLEKDLESHKVAAAENNRVLWAKVDQVQVTLNLVLQAVGELKGRVEH